MKSPERITRDEKEKVATFTKPELFVAAAVLADVVGDEGEFDDDDAAVEPAEGPDVDAEEAETLACDAAKLLD